MKKILVLSVCLVVCPTILAAQTVTSIDTSAVAAGGDFATKAFQDPWDLSQRTDLGWWIFGVDQPASGLTNVQFANGEFTATTTSAQLTQVIQQQISTGGSVTGGDQTTNVPPGS